VIVPGPAPTPNRPWAATIGVDESLDICSVTVETGE